MDKFEVLLRGFLQAPEDDAMGEVLEGVAQQTNRWGELIQAANEAVQEAEGARKVTLCLALARWYSLLDHPEYSQPYLQLALEREPEASRVRRAIAAVLRRTGDHQHTGEELTRALHLAREDAERVDILCDLGDLLTHDMGQPEQGDPFYRRALEVNPSSERARRALGLGAKGSGVPAESPSSPPGEPAPPEARQPFDSVPPWAKG